MPHPKRFYENDYKKYYEKNKDTFKFPYEMPEDEKKAYIAFKYAEKQYLEFVNYLSNISDAPVENNGEPRGIGKTEQGLDKNMDLEAFALLNQKTANLIATGKKLGGFLTDKINEKISKPSTQEIAQKKARGALLYDTGIMVKRAGAEASCMQLMDTENLPSYISMHRQATNICIDTEGKELGRQGANLSNRVPIRFIDEGGKLRQGFFTRDTKNGASPKELFEARHWTSPELKNFYDAMKEEEAYNHMLDSEVDSKTIKNMSPNFVVRAIFRGSPKLYRMAHALPEADAKQVIELYRDMYNSRQITDLHKSHGIAVGQNINSRNTAMSDMATMLNMEKIVAKSVPMTITENGVPVQGNFMVNAKGISMEEIVECAPSVRGKTVEIEYDGVMKDSLNMMVLDYICCNMDRHQNNHFYNFREENGKMILVGLQGIDNDFSFSDKVPSASEKLKYLPPLNAIKHMTTDTMNAVMGLNRSNISATLGNGYLNDKEIEACWTRVEMLQQNIRDNKIQIKDNFTKADFDVYNQDLSDYQKKHIGENNSYCTPMKNINVMESHFTKAQKDYVSHIETENAYNAKEEMVKVHAAFKNRVDPADFPVEQDDPYGALKIEYLKKLTEIRNGVPESDKKKKLLHQTQKDYTNKFNKLSEKIAAASEKEKQLNEKIKKGVANLSSKLQINSEMTFKSQCEKISKLYKKLWSPGKKDPQEYRNVYERMRGIKTVMDKFASDPDFKKRNGILTDNQENYIADQFKGLNQAINEYGRQVYSDLSKSNIDNIIIAEAVQSICQIGMTQREHHVNEINELMSSTMRSLNEANKELNEAKNKYGENSPDFVIAQRKFEAKSYLASFVGEVENPSGERLEKAQRYMGELAFLEELSQPGNKSLREQCSPEYIQKSVDELFTNKQFKDIVNNVNPVTALRVHAEKAITAEAKKFGVQFIAPTEPSVKNDNPTIVM